MNLFRKPGLSDDELNDLEMLRLELESDCGCDCCPDYVAPFSPREMRDAMRKMQNAHNN